MRLAAQRAQEPMNEKIRTAQEILKDQGIPLWLVYSDHGSDTTLEKLVGKAMAPSCLVLSPTEKRVIVHKIEADNFSRGVLGNDLVIYSGRNLREPLVYVMRELGFNDKAALNYTTMRDVLADRIGAGTRDWIDQVVLDSFPGVFSQRQNIRDVLVSGERNLYALYDRKTPDEIAKMRLAAQRAQEILEKAFTNLKPGMSDWDAYKLVQKIATENIPKYLRDKGVIKQEYAWVPEGCPTVLTGKSFTKGGHAMTSGEIIQPGNTIYFDFGVDLYFEDGTHWCSDIQRLGYVLKDGETSPSPEAQRIFDILYESVSEGIDALKPGVKGHTVDEVVRSVVSDAGYKYDHATGHPIGEESHNPGTVIRPLSDFTGTQQLEIQPNGVYTIEPRIPIVNGGSIEEMVLVNPNGKNSTLCPRQEKLYLVQSK